MRQYLRRLETPLSAHHTVAGCDGPGVCLCEPETAWGQNEHRASNASRDAPMP